ncbi:MAG: VanZ family protein, partial [Deltaproteobacteria bacterium]|nr:VanZ family protein [Deltaproteobacteria bacterium]
SVMPGFGGGINSGIRAHGIAYFVFSLTIGRYFASAGTSRPLMKAALAASAYGGLIETIQYAIPYRCGDIMDTVINCAAALAAMLPGALLLKRGPDQDGK